MTDTLTPAVLKFMIQVFETGPHKRRISELRFDYPGLYMEILAAGIYEPAGIDPERLIKVDNGDEWQDGYRKVFKHNGRFAYHVSGLQPVYVTEDDLRLFKFRFEYLPQMLANQLGNVPEVWMDQHIWNLGYFKSTRIVLVRGLNYLRHQEICNTLAQKTVVDTLVLSALAIAPGYIPLPSSHKLIELAVLFSEGFPVRFDKWVSRIDYSWNFKSGLLTWKELTPIKTRAKRKLIIDYLFESGQDGHPKVNTRWLFHKYDIKSKYYDQYFSGVNAELWNQYLGHDDKKCWLRFFDI